VLCLWQGNVWDAFYYNPIGLLLFAGMLVFPVWILSDFLRKKDSFYRFYKGVERVLRRRYITIPCIALVLMNWIWNFYKYV